MPEIGTRFGTRGFSIGPHRGRSTTTAELRAATGILQSFGCLLSADSGGSLAFSRGPSPPRLPPHFRRAANQRLVRLALSKGIRCEHAQ